MVQRGCIPEAQVRTWEAQQGHVCAERSHGRREPRFGLRVCLRARMRHLLLL